MKTLKLKFLGKNLNLLLEESEYTETWNKYLWLYEKNGEFFSDISVNVDWLMKNEIAISKDFENCCFSDPKELYDRINKNFEITSRWVCNGYHVFTF